MIESPYVLELQAEATRKALKIFLEGRFGPLPADLVQRIEATTDLARLNQLVQATARINRLDEFPI